MPVLAIHLSIDRDRLQPVLYPGPDAAANGDVTLATSGADAPAVILFSSGSTGRPKGVVLHHRHLLATARNLSQLTGIRHDHRELLLSSLCHSDGWQRASATLLQGGCVILPDGLLSVPGILEQLHEHRVTGFFTVPPLIRAILRSRQFASRRQAPPAARCKSVVLPLHRSSLHNSWP